MSARPGLCGGNACIAILLWPKQSSGSRGVVERSTTKGFVSIREIICRLLSQVGQASQAADHKQEARQQRCRPNPSVQYLAIAQMSGSCPRNNDLHSAMPRIRQPFVKGPHRRIAGHSSST
jgi:hypothetical protein